ncbi:PaREP1 family protein [Caldivirga sp.]|uniref:PaREP1 family protein n=1 Tax=Caldivirga sp. TaxID=2080243 RepID=UPI003D0E3C49
MEKLIRVAEEKGINVEDLIIEAVSRLDPQEAMKLRLEAAKRYLAEAEDYLAKGDVVQASEKAYKAAEEVIKALAEKYNLVEHQQAVREGRWFAHMLFTASTTLASTLGPWVKEGWDSAYGLHVWGFHEGKLSIEVVKARLNDIKKLIEEASKVL